MLRSAPPRAILPVVAVALLAACDESSSASKPSPSVAASASTRVDISDVEARARKPLGATDVALGVYSVKRAWEAESCSPEGLERAKEPLSHAFVTASRGPGGGLALQLQSCKGLKHCRENLAATQQQKPSDVPELRLTLTHGDEHNRLLGQFYFSGFSSDTGCKGAQVREGWIERAHGGARRVVIRTREGTVPRQGRMCSTTQARKHLASAPCSLQVLDLEFQEKAPKLDCRARPDCARNGDCVAEGGICIAKRADDCRASKLCQEYGYCTPKDGRCRVVSDADCKDTQVCKDQGYCRALPALIGGGLACNDHDPAQKLKQPR